jgi:hypothetical protein
VSGSQSPLPEAALRAVPVGWDGVVQSASGPPAAADDGTSPVLVVSDAWPPTRFLLAPSEPPGVGETVTLVCEPGDDGSGVVVTPVGGYTLVGPLAAAPTLEFNVSSPFAADQSGLVLPAALARGSLVCTATSSVTGQYARPAFSVTPPLTVRLALLPARWPLLQDVLIHVDGGTVLSSFGGLAVALDGAFHAACIDALGADDLRCDDTASILDLPSVW